MIRALRPGGILLLAESNVPYSLCDGKPFPSSSGSAELIEAVETAMKSMGLNPFLRFEIEKIVRATEVFQEIETKEFTFPLGCWPEGQSAISCNMR